MKEPDEQLRRARELLDSGQREQALQELSQLIEANPKNADAWFLRGLTYDEQEHLELALRDYEAALKIDTRFVDAHVNRGFVLDRMGEPKAALKDYEAAIALAPDHALAHRNRGAAWFHLGESERAVADHERSLELDPEDPLTYRNLGAMLLDLKRFDEALVILDRGLALDGNDAQALYYRGRARVNGPDAAGAEADFSAAASLLPKWPDSYFQRANARIRLGNIAGAFEDCGRVLELVPPGHALAEGATKMLKILQNARARQAAPEVKKKWWKLWK